MNPISFSLIIITCLSSGLPVLPLQAKPLSSVTLQVQVIAQSPSTPNSAEDFVERAIQEGKQGEIDDYNQKIRLNQWLSLALWTTISLGAILAFILLKKLSVPPTAAEDLFKRGIQEGNIGDIQEAIADFDQAIRLNPNYADAYYNRGTAYGHLGDSQQQLGDSRKAIADFDQAIRLNPNAADAYSNRAKAYSLLGDSRKAIADLQKAAALFQRQGRTAEAQQSLEFIKQLQP